MDFDACTGFHFAFCGQPIQESVYKAQLSEGVWEKDMLCLGCYTYEHIERHGEA